VVLKGVSTEIYYWGSKITPIHIYMKNQPGEKIQDQQEKDCQDSWHTAARFFPGEIDKKNC
jgi:hypothetical protein